MNFNLAKLNLTRI